MAEAQTQPEDLPTVEDSMEVETAGMAGHNVKRMAAATSEDGGPKGRTILVDDSENTVFEVRARGSLLDEPVGQTPRTEQYQNTDLLQSMTILCQTVQNLGKQMQEGFAAGRTRRQQDFDAEIQKRRDDYNKMEQTMTAKMEGFKGEKAARQQTQD